METALVNRFVASCAETRELLSDYVEGELQPRTRRRVVRHLLMCRRCRAVLRSLKTTIAGLNRLGRDEPPPDPSVADSVIARVRSEHDGDAGP
ncbi:MAG TPA: zf-HC2 domain-containing protein [Gaiellaceae bacterium]|jgi:predicted anti-sigma-YlaC factor YlaD|nr:zf-HC2 domain-containing protein [Gaiellaceae bacterium]